MKRNVLLLRWIYFFKSLWFFAPILTLFYLSRNLSLFQTVSLEAILMLTILIAEVPTGMIADKIGRKKSLFFTTALYILGNTITIYAQSYWLFALTQLFFGIALSFQSGAVEALIYDSLVFEKKEQDMTKIWGSIQAYGLLAGVVATVVGGFIAADQNPTSYVLLLWLYVLGASIAFVLTFFLKEQKTYPVHERKNPLELLKISGKTIFHNKKLKKIVLLGVFSAPFYHSMKFLIQPYFLEAQIPVIYFGMIIAGLMLIETFCSRYAYAIEKKIGMKKTIFIATLFPGIIYILLSLFVHPFIAIVGYVLHGGMTFLKNPLFSQYINIHVSSHHRATVLSLISMFVSAYLLIMRLIIGKIAEYKITSAFLVMGSIIIFAAFLFRIDENDLPT